MTKRSATDLWDALNDATVDAELERVLAMTPEERRRELVATGVDLDQVRARADAVVASIPGVPADASSPAVAHPPPVTLAPHRASRATGVPLKRLRPTIVVSLGLAAAAGLALVIATASMPAPVVGPQPPTHTPASRAESLRRDAREACGKRTWQTCLDKLDQARTIDPAGDEAPAVQALRRSAWDMQPAR
jgi:hypothetical protein